MSEPADDLPILEALERAGTITAPQVARLRRAIKAGASLEDALQTTPMVDPLEFLRARTSISPVASPSLVEQSPSPAAPPPEPSRDEEGVNVLDLGLDESVFEAYLDREPPPRPHIDWPPPPTSDFDSDGRQPHAYNAANDEGVRFIGEVNEDLSSSIGSGAGALFYFIAGSRASRGEFDRHGDELANSAVDLRLAARFQQRLRVMARVEPWKKGVQRGMFRFETERGDFLVLVESRRAEEEDALILYIQRGTTTSG